MNNSVTISVADAPVEPVFEPGYRGSGLLMHLTSLPSPYGIGDMGPAAFAWVDRLRDAGQSWWQCLPLGPTGSGNSPYSALSSFAGNWLLISPDELVADGLLRPSDAENPELSEAEVDFDSVKKHKLHLLQVVSSRFAGADRHWKQAFDRFRHEQSHWLDDYALFRVLKARFRTKSYLEWPAELARRKPEALQRVRREMSDQLQQVRLAQFLVFHQSHRLKQYAHLNGIRLIGDLPFFVSADSSDVWANPELFLLDPKGRQRFDAGVPPDYFSAQGQLWGNPVYDWSRHRATEYRWCIDRVRALLAHVDLIRLDHFRGFVAAWHVPAGARSARGGQWVPGPGAEYFRAVRGAVGRLPFIAEDLGLITPEVYELRDQFRLPGTRVLQFAFDGDAENPYLPQNYIPNSVVFTGTHDNDTTRGWFEGLAEEQRQTVCQYIQRPQLSAGDAAAELMALAWSSVAALALAPLQDLLNLGSDARMNTPGVAEGNWHWRATRQMLDRDDFARLLELTTISNRLPAVPVCEQKDA